jgi:hypothetical protein
LSNSEAPTETEAPEKSQPEVVQDRIIEKMETMLKSLNGASGD